MAVNNAEFEMKKCLKCHYYYPKDDLDSHQKNCEARIECPLCFCDYPTKEVNSHAIKCKGFEDLIKFVNQYSKKIYSNNTLKKFVGVLKEAYGTKLKGRDILRTINEDTFKMDQWVSFDDVKKMECPVCIMEVPLNDIFVLSCVENHKVCYECLLQHSVLKLNQNSPLTCPDGNCNKLIHVNELGCLPFPSNLVKKLVEKYDKQLFDGYVQNAKGAIRCPGKNCNWVAIFDVYERLNVRCDKCNHHFCSICNSQSHYRVECKEIPIITQKWVAWCNIGREARRREKQHLQQQVTNFEQAKAANERRNQELRINFENLKQDETWKMQNCKLCPQCNRVVEKITGCDSMVCGRNYHGGDQQSGCGAGFNWQNAKPYTSQLESQPKLEKLALDAPKQAGNINHSPFKCEKCVKDIIGIRFECIHCKSVNYCENCEGEQTVNHPSGHIFNLITKLQQA